MPTVLGEPVTYDSGFAGPKPAMDPKEQFYRKFESQATVLHEEIANLGNISTAGGERKDAHDHLLSGISRLTKEVSDASEFAPPRDQMIYKEALKALREQLALQTSLLSPSGRFTFSPTSKEAFLASLSVSRNSKSRHLNTSNDENAAPRSATSSSSEKQDGLGALPTFPSSKNYNEELAAHNGSGIRKPSFSSARDIDIRSHSNMHILLPATAARATTAGRIADLDGCVLDMSVPTTITSRGTAGSKPHPFASLMINNVERSLIVAGHVNGPAHITGVRDSVLVVNARQVRMHECENVRVWLWCGSRPIIEGCKGVRFAEIPRGYLTDGQDPSTNQWDQVDDFNWLKTEASPNWSTISEGGEGWIEPQFWETTVHGGPTLSTDDILRAASIPVL